MTTTANSIGLIPSQRHRFSIPRDVAYLNCAYMSPLMDSVVAAGTRGIARKQQPWLLAQDDFFSESECARALFARVVGAQSEQIAIIPAASYGIAVAARNLKVPAGSTILTLADQFPSNVYAWRMLAQTSGAMLEQVRAAAGQSLNQAVLSRLQAGAGRICVVALPHCRWTDGALIDLVEVGQICKRIGAALVLDLTQSAGALPIDLQLVDPDFAVAACYKWLLGPYSLGFLYVAPRWLTGEPLEQGWIGRLGSEDFSRLVEYNDQWAPGAVRFDMGERSSFHLMPMAVAALEQIIEWGVGNIAHTLAAKTEAIAHHAHGQGLLSLPATQRAGHFLGLSFTDKIPDGLLESLRLDGVFLSQRGSSLRITPHLYNDQHDIERLCSALGSL